MPRLRSNHTHSRTFIVSGQIFDPSDWSGYSQKAFFLKVNRDALMKIVNVSHDHCNRISFSLGASYIIDQYRDDVLFLCSKADVIFGNESEYKTLTVKENTGTLENDLTSLIGKISAKPNMIFVITRGPSSVYVYEERNRKLSEYKFEPLDPSEIKDTNAAGDAFAGGFLAQYLMGNHIKICVACGIFAAKEVLRHTGCGFNRNMEFQFHDNIIYT